jgi:repressor LexA
MPFGFEVLLDDQGIPLPRSSPRYLPSRSASLDLPAGVINTKGRRVKALTKREQEAFDAIIEITDRQGYPPSIKQIYEELRVSQTTALTHLQRLVDKGWIERDLATTRGIRILHRPERYSLDESLLVSVRVAGQVAASPPRSAQQVDQYRLHGRRMTIPRQLIGRHDPRQIFILKVEGESMSNAGVLPGDDVVVLEQDHATNGDMVVAEFRDPASEEEITVKYLCEEEGQRWLAPATPGFNKINAAEAMIRGKVIALLRYSIRPL